MAMFDSDKINRIACTCGSSLLFKRPVYTYNKTKTGLIEKLQSTELHCTVCGKLVKTLTTFSGKTQS